MAITEFSGKWRFLSNFYPCAIKMGGYGYRTAEHAYQAAKTTNPSERERIWMAETPGQAKRLGRAVTLRKDWETMKLSVMESILRQKFSKSVFRLKLLETNDEQLIEGNTWGDTYWGVCRGEGQNHLGKILMKLRQEIREHGEVRL